MLTKQGHYGLDRRVALLKLYVKYFALDWSQDPLNILGVTFFPLVFNIWDLNSQEILLKIKNIRNHWSKRKLTLLGRITIIKSLAVSKFVHHFISLPAPPNELISELENYFINFYGIPVRTE